MVFVGGNRSKSFDARLNRQGGRRLIYLLSGTPLLYNIIMFLENVLPLW